MEDPRTSNCFCIGCGYSLRGLNDPRCPECGREFDPSNPKTMARTSRHAAIRRWMRWPLMLFALLVIYVVAYLNVVERSNVSTTIIIGGKSPISLRGGNPPISNRFRTAPIEETYLVRGEWAAYLFYPANWMDRRIRVDYWMQYGCSSRYVPAMRIAVRAMRGDKATKDKGLKLQDTIMRADTLRVGIPDWQKLDKQVWEQVEKLR